MNDTKVTDLTVKKDSEIETAEPEKKAAESTESKKRVMSECYLINGSLTTDDFYSVLKSLTFKKEDGEETYKCKYDYVLGIDFGHGETAAYILKRVYNEEKKTTEYFSEAAKLTEKDTVIPTMIAFDENDEPYIGSDAKDAPVFFQHFKVSPLIWDKQDDEVAYPPKRLISAYYKKLFEQIRTHNGADLEAAYENGKVLICVGCPASTKWTRADAVKKYAKLISEATGVEAVAVVPESTAALMSLLLKSNNIRIKGNGKIDLNKGIAIFDFGSSTIDFTYILPGIKLVTRSINIGGHIIDKLILDVLLAGKKMKKADISDKDLPGVLVSVRDAKERFFNSKGNFKIKFSMLCEEFEITNEVIMEALNSEERPGTGKFIDRIRAFLLECKGTLKGNNCDKVILAGGCSKVIPLTELASDIFGEEKIPKIDNPSLCVADGLCLIKKLEMKGIDYLKNYKKYAYKKACKTYKNVIDQTSKFFVPYVMDTIFLVIDEIIQSNNPKSYNEIVAFIEKKSKEGLHSENGTETQKIKTVFSEAVSSYRADVSKKTNEISRDIYKEDFSISPETPVGKGNMPDEFSAQYKSNGEKAIIQSLLSSVINIIAVIALPISFEAAALIFAYKEVDKDGLVNKVKGYLEKKDTKIPIVVLKTLYAIMKLRIFKHTVRKKVSSKMKGDNYISSKEITKLLVDAEAILGKVMFYVFDEKPDIK